MYHTAGHYIRKPISDIGSVIIFSRLSNMPNVYIGQSVFETDPMTKQKFESYLKDLKQYAHTHDIAVATYDSIQSRMEAKLISVTTYRPLTENDIDALISEMGKPEGLFMSAPAKQASEAVKSDQFYRNPHKGKFLGVCYGLGQAFHIEPIWIRLAFIALFIPLPFVMVLVYVLAALVMKEESEDPPMITNESPSKSAYETVEKGIKKFFETLYKFGEKVMNALK